MSSYVTAIRYHPPRSIFLWICTIAIDKSGLHIINKIYLGDFLLSLLFRRLSQSVMIGFDDNQRTTWRVDSKFSWGVFQRGAYLIEHCSKFFQGQNPERNHKNTVKDKPNYTLPIICIRIWQRMEFGTKIHGWLLESPSCYKFKKLDVRDINIKYTIYR